MVDDVIITLKNWMDKNVLSNQKACCFLNYKKMYFLGAFFPEECAESIFNLANPILFELFAVL